MDLNKLQYRRILLKPGFISDKDFNLALDFAKEKKLGFEEALLEKGLIKDEQLGQLIAEYLGFPFVDLREEKINEKLLKKIPALVAESMGVIPYARDDENIRIGAVNPGDMEVINMLKKVFGRNIKIFYITQRDLNEALLLYKGTLKEEMSLLFENINKSFSSSEKNVLMIKIVDLLFEYGYNNKASDIHIEPQKDNVVIRFRIDGVMHKVLDISKKFYVPILSRIKILAKIRTDEHSSAQDGKFQYFAKKEVIDARVSIVPVNDGENIVIRLLSAKARDIGLENSGLSGSGLNVIKRVIKNPHGMLLVTGPTGCGKTTTLYEILKILNTDKVNIATIEDPVEYNIEGVSQIQVNNKTNLSFASGLRALVRQDPDIIMVGEIRDQETAKIAVNSAMTGHLVLSTMHANDSATTLIRLIDMGIEPYLAVSTVKVIIAQRLIRKLCEKCRYSYRITDEEREAIESDSSLQKIIKDKMHKDIDKLYLYKGKGCKICSGSGYRGREGLFEVMEINDDIKHLVISQSDSDEITKAAQKQGMTSMLENGIEKAVNGKTALEEILRIVGEAKI